MDPNHLKEYNSLVKAVINNAQLEFEPSDCGPTFVWCTMCQESAYSSENSPLSLDTFPHKKGCPYMIAKRLFYEHTDERSN